MVERSEDAGHQHGRATALAELNQGVQVDPEIGGERTGERLGEAGAAQLAAAPGGDLLATAAASSEAANARSSMRRSAMKISRRSVRASSIRRWRT